MATHEVTLALDLVGTFVFAISGAMLGVRRRLDIFGVLSLSFAASSAGGIARDLLVGSVPPAAIADWRYCTPAMVAGLLIFFWHSPISRLQSPILVFDAASLALFAVACFALRLLAIRRGWSLPVARVGDDPDGAGRE